MKPARTERRGVRPGLTDPGSCVDAVIQYIDRRLDAAVERVVALYRICSPEAERSTAAERRLRAQWFADELRGVGLSASVRDMCGPPIVVAHDRSTQGPEVLFCGHYNAWPIDLAREEGPSPPLTPNACGRSIDQPTQAMAFLEACRAWRAVAGQLPTPVSVLIAGEGRLGSVRLTSFLRMYADELKADIGLAPALRISCCAAPAINGTLRGLCCEEFVIVTTPHGHLNERRGVANPMRVLARILGDLHDPSGRVTIPGFYSDIAAPPGDKPGAGPMGATPIWPTCEIEGVGGNHNIDGPHAVARLSFHLVCDQEPDAIRRAFRDFARSRVPSGLQIDFASGALARSVRFPVGRPAFRKAQDALTAEWGRQAIFACGDAAPAVHALRDALSMEVIVTSFPERPGSGRSPRERPELATYRSGIHSWARILGALAQ